MKICEVNREAIDSGVRNKVSNLGLKRSPEELLDQLQPIVKALYQAQSDKCTIAEAVDVLKKLLRHFTDNKQAEKLVKTGMNSLSPKLTFLPTCFIQHFKVKCSVQKR